MRDRVIIDRHPAGVAVDLDDRGMHRVAPGNGRRLPIAGLLEPGLDTLRAAVIPAWTRRLRDCRKAHILAGDADDADPAVAQFEIGRCAFQEVGGDREYLLAQSA